MPDAPTLKAIEEKRKEVNVAIVRLRTSGKLTVVQEGTLSDHFHWGPMIEVFSKAAEWTVRRNEFFQKDSGKQTLSVLDEGLRRANDFPKFRDSLKNVAGRTLACGYRSRIDESIQPYVVTYPLDYGKDPKKKWRLDIVLHGRDNTLTEVKMLAGALKRGATKRDQDFVQLEVFGRGNNAYRWAGETDVFEARAAFLELESMLGRGTHGEVIDRERTVLRGFSMGGAGTWHIGLHFPTEWCVIGPGAGFTSTHGYIKSLPAKLPDYQEACLHIYDAVDYAENATMVPVVAYAGDKDPQQQAATNIEAKLKPLGIHMNRLVGTGLAHQFPPEWQRKAQEAYAPFVRRGRDLNPNKVHFVTYTLSYPNCGWITVLELEQHYRRSSVDAIVTDRGYDIETNNVLALAVRIHPTLSNRKELSVRIDRQAIHMTRPRIEKDHNFQPAFDSNIHFIKDQGVWKEGMRQESVFRGIGKTWQEILIRNHPPRKNCLEHGPIDDAFRQSFVCIRGSGKCANPQVQAYTDAAFERFRQEWEIGFRGDLPIMSEREYLEKMTKGPRKVLPPGELDLTTEPSLILFGDPSSNAVIARIMEEGLDYLPLKWNAKEIAFGGQIYASASHVPVFIYPNLFWPSHYIVINSGHTFHEPDLKGTNALLYPRLGDFAILKPAPSVKDPVAAEVVRAGLFDEKWQVPPGK
jgi:hypothetical protein